METTYDPFDPKNLRLPIDSIPVAPSGDISPPPKVAKVRTKKFIPGRFFPAISEAWLDKARALPGKAPLDVAIVIRQEAALCKSGTISLSNKRFQIYGDAGRYHKTRGLRALKEAGLVTVDWKTGASPIVTIVEDGDCIPSPIEEIVH